MKRILIKSKRILSTAGRMKEILQLQQMAETGIILLDPDFEIIPEPNTWYKAEEASPTPFNDVLFCDDKGEMYIGTMDELRRFVDKTGQSIKNVKAWMPAPEPYEED